MGGQRHASSALPSRMTQYPLYRKVGGPQGRSGRVGKNSPPTGIRSPDRPAGSQSLYRLCYPRPTTKFGQDRIQPCVLVQMVLEHLGSVIGQSVKSVCICDHACKPDLLTEIFTAIAI